jgi:hypothetical protein
VDAFGGGVDHVGAVASASQVTWLSAKHWARSAISPDNRTLAYATGYGVHLIDLTTGREVAEYEDPGITCANFLTGAAETLVFAADGRCVATGHWDGSFLVWPVPRPTATAMTPADRDAAWADLAAADGRTARAAIGRLARDPRAATALLADRFKAPAPPAAADVPALIKYLDSPAFPTREKAARRLREVGPKARPALRGALPTATAEAKERIERLLAALDPSPQLPLTGDVLRGVRAIEVLQRTGTPAARAMLRAWADQTADLSLAAEAGLALDRLQTSK